MRGVCPCDAIAAGSLMADKKTPPPVKKPVNLVWPLPPGSNSSIIWRTTGVTADREQL